MIEATMDGSTMRPMPEHGRIFELSMRPLLADCAPSGRMRMDALARWLQDVAFTDIEEAGVNDAAIWVLRRTRIQVLRFPRFGERCDLLTFCSGFGRMWAERRTSIVPAGGGAPLVEGQALWVHLDPETRRPSPLTERELAVYSEAIGGHRVNARLRHPAPEGPPEHIRDWRFHAIDCDVAAHVNNTAYWRPLDEELIAGGPGLNTEDADLENSGLNEPDSIDAEIEFRSG